MALQDSLDRILQTATEAGAVPGVVAVVTDRDGLIYEGGFGERALASGVGHDPGHRGLDRLHDQGRHRHGGDAAGRAGRLDSMPRPRR